MKQASRYKIGVFGSAEKSPQENLDKASQIGKELASKNAILITGACNGLPYQAALAAYQNGAEIWEFSPCLSSKVQLLDTPGVDLSIYKKIFYIPKSFPFSDNRQICRKYRNVTSIANSDAGIIISGRWGTMNEFTNLYDMGKVIGVLTNTGGIADELPKLTQKISKPSKAKVIFSTSPKELIDKIVRELKKQYNDF